MNRALSSVTTSGDGRKTIIAFGVDVTDYSLTDAERRLSMTAVRVRDRSSLE